MAATFRGGDTDPKETFLWHAAGPGGFGGSALLDAIIHTNRDVTNGWTGAADGTLEQRFHPLQNARGDVVAVADNTGVIKERVVHDPYRLPTMFNPADQKKEPGIGSGT